MGFDWKGGLGFRIRVDEWLGVRRGVMSIMVGLGRGGLWGVDEWLGLGMRVDE